MPRAKTAPYGSWKSPITSDLIVEKTVRLHQIVLDGSDIYWNESRPSEAGRYVVVRWTEGGQAEDITPPPFSARSTVHEYGGGAFTVANGTVYFSNFTDQRVYCQEPGIEPRPITSDGALRYADYVLDRRRNRLICVREDHTDPEREAVNTLTSIPLEDGETRVLMLGSDFFASPRLNPDGTQLAWLTWNHPNMPWDETELWIGAVGLDGKLGPAQRVAGGNGESIFQPEWSPDGVLHFVSDRSGWWNLYRWRGGQIEPLCEMEAEFGIPQWAFGMSTYCFESADRIICTYSQGGIWHLARLDTSRPVPKLEIVETPYTVIDQPLVASGQVIFMAGSATEPTSIVKLDLTTTETQVLHRTSEARVNSAYLSQPQTIAFPTENGQMAHAFFYPPCNPDYRAPEGEKPPLLVISHGGPTSATQATLNMTTQFWTSRGLAVLDVNYGGSTGYGRAYRERLNGQWGIVDVDDCVNGARYLVERGEADGNRLAIRGGSAGGYTTLCALTFRDVFKTGASYYGVSDAEVLAKETHKFESRYLDGLIGPYPECRSLYLERSPIHFTDQLSCPLILFQGLEDKIVLPNQAEMMFEAVRAKGLPVAYVPFEGEQHGFRQAKTIKRALEAELYFYSKIFGFDLTDAIEPVTIHNIA
jgi:dipeptidyl aminopeptidase/acylaminoacyl peptidase